MKPGKVYLVGAGPGDPGLITLRGIECLGVADVIVYDYLVNPAVLSHARPRARRIFAGKRKGEKTISQVEINRLLVKEARAGRTVARLKGGDPLIFGRGGEEALALADAGISFEIVPGVSSVSGVPAYAGIPLTHRGLSATVTLATGHEDSGRPESLIPWDEILSRTGTLVFMMGITHLGEIVERLIKHGRSPETPIAVICWGSWSKQRTVTGVLADIVERSRRESVRPPGLIVVGEVVRLRSRLKWYETRPLFGRQVLVTRPKDQAGELSRILRDAGADPVEVPTIELVPPKSFSALDRAVRKIESYDWLIFTSANGVRVFLDRLWRSGRDLRALHAARICAIGPKTAEAAAHRGVRVDLIPNKYQAEGLLAALGRVPMKGRRVLLPRAQEARELLPQALRRRGAKVDVVPAYRAVRPKGLAEAKKLLQGGSVSVITFTSSSTARNLLDSLGKRSAARILEGVTVAAIGPITAQTVREFGLTPQIVATSSTSAGLVRAMVKFFQKNQVGRGSRPTVSKGR